MVRYRRARSAALNSLLLSCVAAPVAAAANFGFDDAGNDGAPAGWSVRGEGYEIAVDRTIVLAGTGSLRISGNASGGASGGASGNASGGASGGPVARVTQHVPPPPLDGNRLRVTARIRTDAVDGSAGLWLRIDSAEGLLYVDGMREGGAAGTTGWTRYVVEAPRFAAAERIEIGVTLRGGGTAWFDAIELASFDTAVLPAPAPAAARYVERALDIIERNSIRRAAIDWPALREATLAQARGATEPSETYLAIRYALGSLGDHHSYLQTPDRVAALARAPVSNARTGRAAEAPRGERLGDDIAWLHLPGFAGGSFERQIEFAERVQGLIRELDAWQQCGWIVDLRGNTGGNVWPMLAGVGPLLGDGEAAAAVYPDGRRVPLWYREGRAGLGDYVQLRVRGEPYRLRAAKPAIAVLLGPRTASSGEVVAAAFRGLPGQRSFGSTTRGLGDGNRTFDLSDGAALVLTVAATSDRTGAVHFDAMAPDEPTPRSAPGTPLAEQHEVAAAARWLRSSCAEGTRP